MKFSESWLRTLVSPPLDTESLAHQLTMAGLEVEAIEAAGPALDGVVIGEVLSVSRHPDADRLNLTTVNIGSAEPLAIVCGAGNVAPGIRVPVATVGTRLPNGMVIKLAKVRGVASAGMLCSESELGLAPESSGLLLLPADAPVGTPLSEYLNLGDRLITLKLTPNRSDCLSILGIAREVAAITETPLTAPDIPAVVPTSANAMTVRRTSPGCPAYTARLIENVDARRPTPLWMRERLERSGLRSKSILVDISNYVMLELGHPLHAFDADRLQGGLTVRQAAAGESLILLTGAEVTLDPDLLVIADERGPVALAGIMGGQDSAVSDATTRVLLECAFFTPQAVQGRARRLGLSSDAAYRFERGVDFFSRAADRATALILEYCGGEAGPLVEDVQPDYPWQSSLSLRFARARRILGMELGRTEVERVFQRLGWRWESSAEAITVEVPTWRFDVSIDADLVEEVARLIGYDNIPATTPRSRQQMLPATESRRDPRQLARILAARDWQQVINYSFVDRPWEEDLAANTDPIALLNPIASQMGIMRTTLWGGLLENIRSNLNRQQDRIRVFEQGACFSRSNGGYAQVTRLGGAAYGPVIAEQWGERARMVDFYDVKGDVEALCAGMNLHFAAAPHPALHPTRSARIFIDGQPAGFLGVLHPKWQQKYDLPQAPVLFELDLARVLPARLPQVSELSRFPAVRRDMAVVVAESVAVGAMLDAMRRIAPEVVRDLQVFDVYTGKGIETGQKSIAFKVVMQDTARTLKDEEVEAVTEILLNVLSTEFQAILRK